MRMADLHVVGHELTEWCHGRLLCEMSRAIGRRSNVAQSRPPEDEDVSAGRFGPNVLDPAMACRSSTQLG